MDNGNGSDRGGGPPDEESGAPIVRRVDVDRGPFYRIVGALVAVLIAAIACSVLGAAGEFIARVPPDDGRGQPAQVIVSAAAPAVAAAQTTGPQVKPVISAPTEGASLTIGRIPNVAGTAGPGSTVRVFDGDIQIGLVVAGANGAWSLAQLPLAVGPHVLSARVLARDGAVLAQSNSVNVVVVPAATAASTATQAVAATAAPTIPPTAVPSPIALATTAAATAQTESAAPVVAGPLPGFSVPPYPGGVVFAPRPGLLRGQGAQGSRIQLVIQEGSIRTTTTELTVGTDGTWRVQLPRLGPGPIVVQATPLDAAGKALAHPSAPLALTAVDGPVINNLFDGAQISPRSPGEVRGLALPNSKVRVYDGDRLLGDVTADGNGAWVFKLPTLAPGSHALRAAGVDPDGKDAPGASPALRVSAVAAPLPPSFSPVFDNTRVGPGGAAELFGRAEPGSRVRLFDGDRLTGEATADADGNWRMAVPPLATGRHTLTVRAVGADGKEWASPPITVTVSAAPPAAVPAPGAASGSATGSVAGRVSDQSAAADRRRSARRRSSAAPRW